MIQSLSLPEAAAKLASLIKTGKHKSIYELLSNHFRIQTSNPQQRPVQPEEKAIIFSSTFEYLLRNDRLPGEFARLILFSAGEMVHFVAIRGEDFPEGMTSCLSETEQHSLIAVLDPCSPDEELVVTSRALAIEKSPKTLRTQARQATCEVTPSPPRRPAFIRHDPHRKRRRRSNKS